MTTYKLQQALCLAQAHSADASCAGVQVPVTVGINGTTVNGSTCAVSYSLTQAGEGPQTAAGDVNYLSSLQLTLTNLAPSAPIAVPYTVSVNNTAYTGAIQSTGLNLTDSSALAGVITGNVPGYWNVLWPSASNNISLSMLLQGSSADLAPSTVSICCTCSHHNIECRSCDDSTLRLSPLSMRHMQLQLFCWDLSPLHAAYLLLQRPKSHHHHLQLPPTPFKLPTTSQQLTEGHLYWYIVIHIRIHSTLS